MHSFKPTVCLSDPLIEYLSDEFLRTTMNEFAVAGEGAKNIVFTHPDVDYVIRMSFAHGGNCVFTYDIYSFAKAIDGCSSTSFCGLLNHSLDVMRRYVSRRPVKDIMSNESLITEKVQSVLPPASPGLIFGVNSEIARMRMCLQPRTSVDVFTISNTKGTACRLTEPLSIVLEVNRRYLGDVAGLLLHFERLSILDLVILAHGYVVDLAMMHHYHRWVPTDAHPGNLLYNLSSSGDLVFVWADFGRTSGEERAEAAVQVGGEHENSTVQCVEAA